MKITAIGADISRNDVSCSNTLVENIESDLYKLKALGARDAALTNVTGDDVVVSAFVEDDLLESVNEGIVNILKDNAENLVTFQEYLKVRILQGRYIFMLKPAFAKTDILMLLF